MRGQPRHMTRDIAWVLSSLRASEIYVMLQTCDEGMRIWISDRLFKTRVDHAVSSRRKNRYEPVEPTAKAALWLHEQALHLFPDSNYAQQFLGCGRESTATQSGPHTVPHDKLQDSQCWKGRAEEARKLASGLHDVTSQALMLDIAYNYDLMAERTARNEDG